MLVGGTIGFFLALRVARARAFVPAALAVLGGLGVHCPRIRRPAADRPLPAPAGGDARDLLRLRGARLAATSRRATLRRRWMIGGIALLVVFAVFAPANVSGLSNMRDGVQLRGKIEDDLRELARRTGAICSSAARRSTCPTTARSRSSPGSWTGNRRRSCPHSSSAPGAASSSLRRPRRRGEVRARPERPEATGGGRAAAVHPRDG